MRGFTSLLFAFGILGSACGESDGDGDDNGVTAPSAPTNLAASNVGGGAHLTWSDNSDNEEHFMIMRKPVGGTFDEIDMVTFDIAQYHDSSVTAGMTYVYMVMAMNAAGEASSNEVTFTP